MKKDNHSPKEKGNSLCFDNKDNSCGIATSPADTHNQKDKCKCGRLKSVKSKHCKICFFNKKGRNSVTRAFNYERSKRLT